MALPAHAAQPFLLRDAGSGVEVRVSLVGARATAGESREGSLVFPAALGEEGGGDGRHGELRLRVGGAGVEDFVAWQREPARREVRYRLGLGATVAGLRQVGGTIELLDAGGAPRLRMDEPYLIDARGERVGASVEVAGCAVDTSTAPPWGRPVVAAGARECEVRVSWAAGVRYPAVLDPVWSSTGAMPSVRSGHVAALLPGERVLVAGGVTPNGIELNTTVVYDRATSTWAVSGKMSVERRFAAAIPLDDGRVLVTGGSRDSGVLASLERYEPGPGQWTVGPPMSAAREFHAVLRLTDGRILIAGGDTLKTDLYDPVSDTTTPGGDLSVTRNYLQLGLLPDGRAMAVGGRVGVATHLASTEIYDPATNQWTASSPMKKARSMAKMARMSDGRLLITGGRNSDPTVKGTTEFFDPASGLWEFGPNMADLRENHEVITLLSGKVLVTGGGSNYNDSAKLASAELLDPGVGSWQTLEPMAHGRALHTMTLLPSGEVLVVGHHIQSTPGAGVELFGLLAGSGQCGVDGECQSGHCVDGVCCDSPCDAPCQACTAAKKGAGADGSCGPVAAGVDPDGDCADDGSPSCQNNGLCDGAGACQKYPASPCSASPCAGDGECASGHCVDGVCCDTACDGPCRACSKGKKGAGVDGVCEPVVAGSDPDNECEQDAAFPYSCKGDGLCDGAGKCRDFAPEGTICNDNPQCVGGVEVAPRCNAAHQCDPNIHTCEPFVCDKGGKLCADSCSDDTRCAKSAYCDVPQGVCVADRKGGEACGGDSQCESGYCVDGVCCDAACDGPCFACSAVKKGAGADGVCGPVKSGEDPDGDCPDDGAPSCDRDGKCDGTGNCRLYPLKTPCSGFSQCAGVSSMTTAVCDGLGECSLDPQVISCGKYACVQGKCLAVCNKSDDCAPGYVCQQGACGALLGNGQSCGASDQCESGFCVDGVCCNTPCTGQCEACDVSEGGKVGTCSAVSGEPHGTRPGCTSSDEECAGTCDGANRQVCSYPGEDVLCQATSCSSAVLIPVACNGKGSCSVGSSRSCAPYECDKIGCKTQCATSSDCAAGAVCDPDKKQCAFLGVACADPFTLKLASGKEQSCAPYSCSGGVCKSLCASSAECAEGFVCIGQSCLRETGAAGAAGAASAGSAGAGAPAPGDDGGGCGCRAAPSTRGAGWLALLALSGMALRRRRCPATGASHGSDCVRARLE